MLGIQTASRRGVATPSDEAYRLTMTALHRRLFAGALALSVVAGMPAPGPAPVAQSSDNARYAAIVVDASTGEVLFGRHADARRYPASVTKIMTLYMVFDALSKGQVHLDDVVTVSPTAAAQPPSKLGLAAGQTIRLDDAMRATAVRSANDMAVVLAEHVGGSQARFAAMSTLKAEELGMTQTRYVNPHGLPDSRQLTSARDLAILSRAVMRDFPQYYSYFGLHDWAYQGRAYRNTNGLLLSGNGYDGIKTGYINAAGYNLAASAVRDGRRIITVVLGGRSSASRNAHVAELMNTGFEVGNRRARGETIQVAQTFFEQRGFGGSGFDMAGEAPIAFASLGGERESGIGSGEMAYLSAPASRPTPARGPTEVAYTAAPPPRPAPPRAEPSSPIHVAGTPPMSSRPTPVAPAPRPSARAEARAPASLTASLNGGTTTARGIPPTVATTSSRPPATPATRPAARWSVQVGAFRDETVARDWLAEVNRRFRSQFATAERTVQSAAGWHRSRFTGLTQDAATAACAALSARNVTCVVVRPE